MKIVGRRNGLFFLACLLVTTISLLGSLSIIFHRKVSKTNGGAHKSMTSWIRRQADSSYLKGFVQSWINSTLAEGTDDKTAKETSLPPVFEKGFILIDRRVVEEVSAKVRVLCWIPTREIYRETRLKALNSTWVKRCDKVLYFITSPKIKSHNVIDVPIYDSRRTLTDKTVYAHNYIYQRYLHKFDWFLKADDDTYVIMENLKFLLSHFDHSVPGYIGCQFKHFAPQGYMSGGASYAFNALGLQALVEKGYRIPGRCRLKGGAEDIETGRCAYKAGVRTLDQLDRTGKQTFFPSNVYANVVGPIPQWAASYSRAKVTAGLACCSPLLVSFHYSGPKLMMLTEFFLYRVVVHGRREVIVSKPERGEEKGGVGEREEEGGGGMFEGVAKPERREGGRGERGGEGGMFDEVAKTERGGRRGGGRGGRMFDGVVALDMPLGERRRAYPGEKLLDYYKPDWRKKNTTIYINPNQ